MANEAVDKKTSTYRTFRGPLILYAVLFGLYVGLKPGKWIWFSYHPIGMLIAFVALAGNATLLKKIGGYDNTKMHGNLMAAATALGAFAWYVIYSNKEAYGKVHLKSLHGKAGFAVMIGYLSLGAFGAIGLHPDWGIVKTNQTIRWAHKWTGRLLTAVAWWCCVTGFMGMHAELWKQVLFTLPLLVAGPFILI